MSNSDWRGHDIQIRTAVMVDKSSGIPGIVVLYYRDLLKSEIQVRPGYKYTGPLRTILDLLESVHGLCAPTG